MTGAYDENYLDDAMETLGEAADFAVGSCNMSLDEFFDLFIATGIAFQFAKGVPKYVAGLSGTELVYEVVGKSGIEQPLPVPQAKYDRSPAYWCGWIIAYYQWYSGMDFKEIFASISPEEFQRLYPALHEASEEKAADVLNKIIERKAASTKLQSLRKNIGYSQRELAEKAGVNLRTLQQYELKAKDINNAASKTLLSLAKVLGCRIEDIMEK